MSMAYYFSMRVFEVVLRSGAKAEITAEILHDDSGEDNRIYFYRDKGLKQIVAYFNKEDVAGIVFGPDHSSISPRYK
jgi:hypothetical protein